MAGLQDALLNNFANELEREAGDREVWAFIATYDERGEFAWKAYADADDLGNVATLGSKMVKFESVKDEFDEVE